MNIIAIATLIYLILVLVLPFFLLKLRKLEEKHKKRVTVILILFEVFLAYLYWKLFYGEYVHYRFLQIIGESISFGDVRNLLHIFDVILAIFGIVLLMVAIIKTIRYSKKGEDKGLSQIICLLIISYYLHFQIF